MSEVVVGLTACTSENCQGLKSKAIKAAFYKMLVEFSLYLVRSSCKNVNPNFICDVYNSYKRSRDFFSCFLEFDRNEQLLQMPEVFFDTEI